MHLYNVGARVPGTTEVGDPVTSVRASAAIRVVVNTLPNFGRPPKVPKTKVSLFYVRKVASHGHVNTLKRAPRPGVSTVRVIGAMMQVMMLLGVCLSGATAGPSFSVQQVADGDYVHFGSVALTSPQNAGAVSYTHLTLPTICSV